MLTIFKNHPGENFVHKHKTIKFDAVGERSVTKHNPNQTNRLKRVEKTASPQITAHVF